MYFKLKIILFLVKIKTERLLGLQHREWYKKIKILFFLSHLKRSDFYSSFHLIREKFSQLPLMNKSLLMQHFNAINTCGVTYQQAFDLALNAEKSRDFSATIGEISVGLSTGTSGNRGMFLVSDSERAKWVAYMIDRVIGFSFNKTKVAFFLRANNKLYESARSNRLSFNFFDIYKKFDDHIERLNALHPDILIAQPSVLMILAQKKQANLLTINPSKIISVAEVLTQEDRSYIEAVFQLKLAEVYQCTEGFLASSCSEGNLHFNEDFLIIEKKYLNKEKTKFHPIVTDLLRKTQPIVRYELNDIISLKESCSCGSKFLTIDSIEGRSDDLITFVDKNKTKVRIFPDILRRTIVLSCERIEDYVLIQKQDKVLELYIKSQKEESYALAVNALVKVLKKYTIVDFKIYKLASYEFKIGDKKRRIINESN
jgi:putative adenylate-forming enzyme